MSTYHVGWAGQELAMTMSVKLDMYHRKPILCDKCSGVVGRERMGTAFPHKKLSGNGVPTREILRDIFSLLLLNYKYFALLHARPTMYQNWTSEFAKY